MARRLGRIAIAIVLIAALGIPWALLRAPVFRQWWLSQQWDSWDLIALAIYAALVLLVAIWWLWWRLPKRQVHGLDIQIHDPKARADTEDNFRKTVGQALGGAAVLIGAGAAYLQFAQQQQAAHDLLISNQVSKGFEQLASDKVTERLGGIYALEGAMKTSGQYRQPVLEALSAFARRSDATGKANNKLSDDIQAALTVIATHKPEFGAVNLAGANIPGANLLGADLSGADLSGANLLGANLSDAYLRGTDLSGAILVGANLSSSDLREANLHGAALTGEVTAHLRCQVGGRPNGVTLPCGATLPSGATLLMAANLSGADLNRTNLSEADLAGTDLSGANLSGANLDWANLRGANVDRANLISASPTGVDLTDVDLHSTPLFQQWLDEACGKPKALPPGLTLDKPCPPRPAAP